MSTQWEESPSLRALVAEIEDAVKKTVVKSTVLHLSRAAESFDDYAREADSDGESSAAWANRLVAHELRFVIDTISEEFL